jgi:hypothetical protein
MKKDKFHWVGFALITIAIINGNFKYLLSSDSPEHMGAGLFNVLFIIVGIVLIYKHYQKPKDNTPSSNNAV